MTAHALAFAPTGDFEVVGRRGRRAVIAAGGSKRAWLHRARAVRAPRARAPGADTEALRGEQ